MARKKKKKDLKNVTETPAPEVSISQELVKKKYVYFKRKI